MKAVVAAFNQEKALVGAFSVITNLRMELFQALVLGPGPGGCRDLAKPTPDLAQPIMVTLIESEECNKFPHRKRRCKS